MTIAYWSLLAALLLPYVAAMIAKLTAGNFNPQQHNSDPRAFLADVQGLARRANNAQQNSFETTPAFAAAVLVAHQLANAGQGLIDVLAVAFVLSRVAFLICYLANWPTLRSLVWTLGLGLIVALFIVSA